LKFPDRIRRLWRGNFKQAALVSSSSAPERRLCTWLAKGKNRIGLVNGIAVSIHHVAKPVRFCPVAFIFNEWEPRMVNRWCARNALARCVQVPA